MNNEKSLIKKDASPRFGLRLNIKFFIVLLILAVAVFQSCSSTGSLSETSAAGRGGTSASGASGTARRTDAAATGSPSSGERGSNNGLAPQILEDASGPIYIQNLLDNNFNKYSAFNFLVPALICHCWKFYRFGSKPKAARRRA